MLVEAVRRFFGVHGIGPCRIVAAVSGGVDSTALLFTLTSLRDDGFIITCAHVNHHLRGVDADEDETYVRDLCASLNVPFASADGSLDPALVASHGIEAAAREVRTTLLQQIRAESGARHIATAHQMNDQAETVLMRLFTGSGIAGLRGIHPVRADGFIRPLLGVTRAEIEEDLRARGVSPRFDRMNADPRYLRVRIRESLRAYDAAVIQNIAAVADEVREGWSALESLIDAAEKSFVEVDEDSARFNGWPEDPWLRRALLQRHIQRLDATREISAADLHRIERQLDSAKRLSITGRLELVRRNGALELRRPPSPVPQFEIEVAGPGETNLPEIDATLTVRRVIGSIDAASALRAAANDTPEPSGRQLIQLPPGSAPSFVVRNRRDGDRFRPLGMAREKKLKELLIDRKIPAESRDRLPLVLWNSQIVWVAGVEVSDSFKITDAPGDVYEFTLR